MISVRSSARFAAMLAVAASAACAPASSRAAPGGVTLEQFLKRQTDRMMAADTDGDGKVSRAERAAMATTGAKKGSAKGGRDPSRAFDRMDLNHDGYLDKAEITAALTKRFHRMDRNGDGVLTAEERMAAHAQRGQNTLTDGGAVPQI